MFTQDCVISTVLYNVQSIPTLKELSSESLFTSKWSKQYVLLHIHAHNNYIMAQKPISSSNSQ